MKTTISTLNKTVKLPVNKNKVLVSLAGMMKSIIFSLFSSMLLAMLLPTKGFTQNITLTSSPVAAANIAQGTSNNIVYIVKMDVASLPVVVDHILFTLTGTHDNNDLTTLNLYFNASAPIVSGAVFLGNTSGLFAAPHTYNTPFNSNGPQTIAAGASGYFIITVNTDPAATNGNTIKLDGALNPVTFTYTTSPSISNNQTDIAGVQTILAAGVTLTSSPVAAANIAQGTTNNIAYTVKMDVASLPVTVNSIQFTLTGTHDNNDLTTLNLYFNASTPSVSGAVFLGNASGLFAAPHTYNTPFNSNGPQTITAGTSGYFIITINTDPAATNGNTVKLDGAANPVGFGFTTSPTIVNNQTDIAGVQTILAAGVTLTSSTVAAANIAQGTTNHIAYIVKMDVASLPATMNSIQFTLTGTHDNNDLTLLNIFFNATAPSLTGATQMGAASATFAAPHAYNGTFNFFGPLTIAAGASGYFIIAANTDAAATNGNTVKLDGAANPVSFGYTTSPTITNNQTDIAGVQTILAAGITLTSSTVAATNIAQGTRNNIVYIVKMDVASLPVTINSILFTLTGTHDNNDLTLLNIFFNASAPSLMGATQMGATSATFAAPHAYNAAFNFFGPLTIAAGASGYFIITASTDAAATSGNTVKLNGAVNPISFVFTTSPPVTNNQTDAAGIQSISSPLPVTLVSFTGKPLNTQQVQLQWITAGELNTKNFEVEWGNDGQHFSKIAILSAAGNSTHDLHYSYLHKLPLNGNNYYRLKSVDLDGSSTWSAIVKVAIADGAYVSLFPNPAITGIGVTVSSGIAATKPIAYLYDAKGSLLQSFKIVGTYQAVNISLLPAGVYHIQFMYNQKPQNLSFIKK